MVEFNKEEEKKKLEEGEKSKPFWQDLHPVVLIGGLALIILAFRSMQQSGGNGYITMIIAVIIFWFMLGEMKKKQDPIVSPKEAELLVERECERKVRWNQYPFTAQNKVSAGPVSDIMHRDARGMYYNVGVEVRDPFVPTPFYFIAKVMARGDERGFVTFIKSVGPLDGKEIFQETDVTRPPKWLENTRRWPELGKIFFGRGGTL